MKTGPVMARTKKPAGRYDVDGRVTIGLDALDEIQKRAVGEVIADRAHFLAHAADQRNVEPISKKGSVYALSLPTGLNIIYKVSGGDIEVLDLMGKETLRKYGAKKKVTRNKTLKPRGKPKGSV
jgi:hypothetical protein